MESRSATSSPDPLGPPGDAEYLISSPLKPLPDYRHVASSPKRTPSVQTQKKANSKSSQPVRLQDIVMSATPTPGRTSESRLSPTKSTVHSENNLSPWRIRVTVEAEHEDGQDNGEATLNKLSPGTRMAKIPLKKENKSPSPKKKRGRPRKSDVSQGNQTPSKTNRNTPKAKADSGGKRKRGTPRKSLPDSDVAESIERRDHSDSAGAKSRGGNLFGVAPKQITDAEMANQIPNYGDFYEDNGLGAISSNNSSPRPSKKRLSNIPNLAPKELESELDEHESLTPTKQPSSGRRRAEVSPENTTYAGHTPGPRSRFYPTPTTSSSLVEDEQHAKPTNTSMGDDMNIEEAVDMVDVTQGPREFDTIMESEGFSMVSLDTLPSAKQHVDSAAKKLPQGSNFEAKQMGPPAAIPHIKPLAEAKSSRLSRRSQTLHNTEKSTSLQAKHTPAINNASPKQPPPPAQTVQPPSLATKKSIPRLARVVRSGIALQGVLDRRGKNSTLRSPFSSPGPSPSKSPSERKKRLDDLFQGFDLETQRELRAGLRFGEELAKRQRDADAERRNLEARRSTEIRHDPGDEMELDPVYPKLPMSDFEAGYESPLREEDSFQDDGVRPTTPINESGGSPKATDVSSEMLRREEEWQREREAISREIQMANSSQVIVIDSDDDGDGDDNAERDPSGNASNSLVDYGEELVEDDDYYEDDDEYEDIWQLEARGDDPLGESTSFINTTEQEIPKSRRSEIPSPWKRGEEVDYSQDVETAPSLFWGSRSQRGTSVLSNVETQMKKLREQEVDISALLKEQAAQSRAFYEDDMPASVQKRSPATRLKRPMMNTKNTQTRSSPFAFAKASSRIQSQQKTPLEKSNPNARERERSLSAEPEPHSDSQREDDYMEDKENFPEGPLSESSPHQQNQHMHESPEPPAPDEHTTPSWFRRGLTSLTPNWLKSAAMEPKSSSPLADPPELHVSPQVSEKAFNPPPRPQQKSPVHHSPPAKKPTHEFHNRRNQAPEGLAISGYFTNDHYSLLRRLYRQAKATPELFPYNPTPKRTAMLGQWMWSADGVHGRPITELQIAIVDRFTHELIHNSTRSGSEDGERHLGWSEEELVRRLFSIIVGEKVRRERKLREAQMNKRRRDAFRRRHVEIED